MNRIPSFDSANIYTDGNGLADLKLAAKNKSPEALKEVARQFEGIMVQMMMKSMRKANLGEGIFENDQTKFYQDMYDKQLSLQLTKNGGLGLADLIESQLNGSTQPHVKNQTVQNYLANPVPDKTIKPSLALQKTGMTPENPDFFDNPSQFVKTVWPHMEKAAAALGVKPDVLISQAALETGWGKHVPQSTNGSSSHNLFGIKAGPDWQGKTVVKNTLEFEAGMMKQKKQSFRAYDNYADSVQDYVQFIKNRPRYQTALNQAQHSATYLKELQGAGYATDPQYATKISAILQGDVLKQSLLELKHLNNQPITYKGEV